MSEVPMYHDVLLMLNPTPYTPPLPPTVTPKP